MIDNDQRLSFLIHSNRFVLKLCEPVLLQKYVPFLNFQVMHIVICGPDDVPNPNVQFMDRIMITLMRKLNEVNEYGVPTGEETVRNISTLWNVLSLYGSWVSWTNEFLFVECFVFADRSLLKMLVSIDGDCWCPDTNLSHLDSLCRNHEVSIIIGGSIYLLMVWKHFREIWYDVVNYTYPPV